MKRNSQREDETKNIRKFDTRTATCLADIANRLRNGEGAKIFRFTAKAGAALKFVGRL